MAAQAPPQMVPPGRVPNAKPQNRSAVLPVVTPQLPFGANPGTITNTTMTKMLESISIGLERGFNHLVDNIPDVNAATYPAIM
jgi:hypothetical protein